MTSQTATLILSDPIRYRPPGEDVASPYDSNIVCISAGRIVAMFVTYLDKTINSSQQAGAALEAQPSTAEAQSSASARP